MGIVRCNGVKNGIKVLLGLLGFSRNGEGLDVDRDFVGFSGFEDKIPVSSDVIILGDVP